MRRTKRMLWLAPLAALVAVATIVGRAEIGDAAPQVNAATVTRPSHASARRCILGLAGEKTVRNDHNTGRR